MQVYINKSVIKKGVVLLSNFTINLYFRNENCKEGKRKWDSKSKCGQSLLHVCI